MLMMSSDLTMYTGNVFNSTSTAAASAAQPGDELSYAEAFPPLPTTVSSGNGDDAMLPASPTSSGKNQWGKKMSVRSSTTTQVCVMSASSLLYEVVVVVVLFSNKALQTKNIAGYHKRHQSPLKLAP